MAQDVVIQGVTYPEVPAVELPAAAGGTARFLEETALGENLSLWEKYSADTEWELVDKGNIYGPSILTYGYASYSIDANGCLTLTEELTKKPYYTLFKKDTNGEAKECVYVTTSMGINFFRHYVVEVKSVLPIEYLGLVTSPDPEAYPQDGAQDGFYYVYKMQGYMKTESPV